MPGPAGKRKYTAKQMLRSTERLRQNNNIAPYALTIKLELQNK
jgi:hypothetical protein